MRLHFAPPEKFQLGFILWCWLVLLLVTIIIIILILVIIIDFVLPLPPHVDFCLP